jgi:hypothetical protein
MKPNPEIAHTTGRVWWMDVKNESSWQLGEGIVSGNYS